MPAGSGSVSLNGLNTPTTQTFDSLVNTAGATTASTLPSGWYFDEAGGSARDNEQYAVDTGAGNTGDTFSYGATGATDRALGQLRSGTLISTIGAQFTNNTGGAIGALAISYTGEEWRLGTAGRADRLDFQISFNATGVTDTAATWIDVNELDFATPNTVGVGAKDGNLAANQAALSFTYMLGTALASGATFWIRWVDSDASGADDGLAIDNFSISAAAPVAGPGVLTIANAAVGEGNSGDANLAFAVNRAGGSAGAVSATYTVTLGNGAGFADAGDFGAGFVTTGTVTFADGATSATILIPVRGDTVFEPNETFAIALSAPAGGATLGAQATATGTITNDDAAPAGTLGIAAATVAEGDGGTSDIVFVVTRTGGSAGAVSATYTVAFTSGNGRASANDFGPAFSASGTVTFADGATTAEIRLPVQGDVAFEPTETFTVTLSAPTGGASIGTPTATGTIVNDDPIPPPANVFINEIHYDNAGTDSGEMIEIAGVAGTDLTGYRLVFYNGSNTPGAAPTYAVSPGTAADGFALSGIIDDEQNGYGAIAFSTVGLQNGPADGVALIAPNGTVIELLSYQGVFTAAVGTPAAGVTSTDIGVSEEGGGPVGASLQLAGNGATGADFTWQPDAANSFGSLNPGQTIIADTATGLVRVIDAGVVEGSGGTTNLVFTIRRAGGLGSAASVQYATVAGSAGEGTDFTPVSGTVTFAVGQRTATVSVAVNPDAVGELNETLSLVLSNPVGNISIVDANATGTILNDDTIALSIGQIQGEGHRSAFVGQPVITNGIVTAVDTNGFYLQSGVGDGNARTSDGIFVFTRTPPTVAVGDEANVRGTVTEFAGSADGLSVTQIEPTSVTVASSNNALPAAVLIGTGGVLPPSQVIDDDDFASYDPISDGIDFWESLEGMRVTLDTPRAVSNTTNLGETDVVVSGGAGATGNNDRGGITISPNANGTVDYNPEKIQIDDDSGVFAGFNPNYSIGDRLSNVTGIVNYAFNTYEVVVTAPVTVTQDVTLTREVTALQGDTNYLSLATYNVENLDPGDMKFDILAGDIVYNLRAPDILALQEIQDGDGAGGGANLSGTVTAQGLIDAIFAQSGLRYGYIEIAPSAANTTGGEPGGNIRNGYLYNLDRVSYVEGSAALIEAPAYNGSRRPLVAQFQFAGQTLTAIDVHFTSRGGSEPLWGNHQPADAAGEAARTAQAAAVKGYVQGLLAAAPGLNVAILGDWNGFYFEDAQTQLTDPAKGGVFTNLNTLLPAQERYSYLFEGNAQQIDNILVTGGLVPGAKYDAVHLNSQFGAAGRPTDHDPQVTLLFLGAAPTALTFSNAAVDENLPAGTIVGTLAATDTANDRLTYSLVDNAGGRFAVDAATGVVTTTGPLDREAAASYTVIGRATDGGGLTVQAGFTVTVNNVNEAPALDLNTGRAGTDTSVSYVENDPATRIAPSATVGDVDSTNFDGGVLTAAFTNGATATDQLTVIQDAVITIVNGSVRVNGVAVATLTVSAIGLTFQLNANATPAAVQALVRNIAYSNVSDAPSTLARSVSVTLVDGDGVARGGTDTADAIATVAVTAINDAPTARADVASTTKNAAVTVNVLANDIDPDSNTLTIVSATSPKGSAAIVNNQLVFTPGAAFAGLTAGQSETVVVSYTIADGNGATSSATVTVTVGGGNTSPTAVNDTASGTENGVLTVSVLGNDTDPDPGAVLTLTGATAPAGKGTATVAGNQLVFTPGTDFDHLAAGATEVVTLGYTIRDDQNAAASGTLTVTLTGTNDAPTGVADVATTAEGGSVTINVLANDRDVDDGAVLTLTGATAPVGKGTVSIVGNQLLFTPGTDFTGLNAGQSETVVVPYTFRDEAGATASATLSVTITGAGSSAPPTTVPQFQLLVPSGAATIVQGTGTVFGTADGTQDVTVRDVPGQIQFDGSFNAGGDRIRLSGTAGSYVVSRSGSSFVISDGDTVITVPIGNRGADIIFADGVRSVTFDTASQTTLLGGQAVTGVPAAITAPAGPAVATGATDPSVTPLLLANPGGVFTASGTVAVLGSRSGAETIYVLSRSTVTFDASFNAGGDTIVLPGAANGYTATRSGSSLLLVSATESLIVPVGVFGATLRFTDGDRLLVFDQAAGVVKLGTQVVGTAAAPVADVPSDADIARIFAVEPASFQHGMDTPHTAQAGDFATFIL